jgi:uncharacterized protein (DUF2461 family)
MPASPHFDRELMKFLSDLRAKNNGEWFHANKESYQKTGRDHPPPCHCHFRG